ncbi:MAG: Ig-like domain-containing protein [Deltaproteobacteria bacterium]|nr:Ig-like domain-containing protein [Deltaproteobacteria bacterium]
MRALAVAVVITGIGCDGLLFKEGLGGPCAIDADCAEGVCVSDACAPAECSVDDDCAFGRCRTLRCTPECATHADCREGVCDSGACRAVVTSEVVIDAAGGVLLIPGVVQVEIPAGALPVGAVVVARVVPPDLAPDGIVATALASDVIHLDTDAPEPFAASVAISLFHRGVTSDATVIVAATAADENGPPTPLHVQALTQDTATLLTRHFSYYVLLYRPFATPSGGEVSTVTPISGYLKAAYVGYTASHAVNAAAMVATAARLRGFNLLFANVGGIVTSLDGSFLVTTQMASKDSECSDNGQCATGRCRDGRCVIGYFGSSCSDDSDCPYETCEGLPSICIHWGADGDGPGVVADNYSGMSSGGEGSRIEAWVNVGGAQEGEDLARFLYGPATESERDERLVALVRVVRSAAVAAAAAGLDGLHLNLELDGGHCGSVDEDHRNYCANSQYDVVRLAAALTQGEPFCDRTRGQTCARDFRLSVSTLLDWEPATLGALLAAGASLVVDQAYNRGSAAPGAGLPAANSFLQDYRADLVSRLDAAHAVLGSDFAERYAIALPAYGDPSDLHHLDVENLNVASSIVSAGLRWPTPGGVIRGAAIYDVTGVGLANWTASTEYQISIDMLSAFDRLFPSAAEGEGEGEGEADSSTIGAFPVYTDDPTDVTSLDVVQTIPGDGEVNVPVSTTVSIFFDDEVDPASITDMAITLRDSTGAPVFGQYSGVLTTSERTILAFQPFELLQEEHVYSVAIAPETGLLDDGGNGFASMYSFGFTTGGAGSDPPPDLGFEAGLAGWWTSGDAAVLTGAQGALAPTEGAQMLAISTESVFGGTAASLLYSVATSGPIAVTGASLVFDYDFLSREFDQYVGEDYDDTFSLDVMGPNGSMSGVVTSVNLVGANASVASDFPLLAGVEHTDWTSESVNVSELGSPIIVTFRVTDIADHYVDSVVLVDNLRFQ